MRSAFFLLLCGSGASVLAATVTIDNLKPRLDSAGVIMDIHDGSIQQFPQLGDSLFYYHGVQYGLCQEPPHKGCDQVPKDNPCGFRFNHNITIYTTTDLSSGSWKFEGNALEIADRPAGVVFRPHAVYNPNTHLYVLMWNWVHPHGPYAGNAVATSSSPLGPFTTQVTVLNVTRAPGGDYDIFYDPSDNAGYIIYSADHLISIEKLNNDFLSSTGQIATVTPHHSAGVGIFPVDFVEAPAVFKRGSTWYAQFGHCCCFCKQGSGLFVFTAPHPMGPWVEQPGGNVACVNSVELSAVPPSPLGTDPTPGQGCLYPSHSTQVSTTRSQQNYVVEVPAPNGAFTYIYTGDRWQQAPDGIKGHEPQSWLIMSFDATTGAVQPLKWQDSITFDVK